MTLVLDFESRATFPSAGRNGTRPVVIGFEQPSDFLARERLLDQAFGVARFDKTVEKLRAGRLPARGLALTANRGDSLVGTVRLWHVQAGGGPALLLGPLAVAEACRSQGIGRALMEEALDRAASIGHAAILLVGDPAYYEPFGFSRRHTQRLFLPGPVDEARCLGLELKEGALKEASGMVTASGAREFFPAQSEIAVRRAA
ncbi:MAG: N-acetyltransferase [Beijerinckiaceae bacterium]|nr:N-acetyltransferase [Beijerinckiaceae bacterium]